MRGKLIRLALADNSKTTSLVNDSGPPKPPSDMHTTLNITLLSSPSRPRVVGLAKEHVEWSKYMHMYVHGPEADLDVRKHHLFLPRNVKKSFADREAATQNTISKNGSFPFFSFFFL